MTECNFCDKCIVDGSPEPGTSRRQIQSLEEAMQELEAELGITMSEVKQKVSADKPSAMQTSGLDVRVGSENGGHYAQSRTLSTPKHHPEMDDQDLPEGMRASAYRMDHNDRVSFAVMQCGAQ